MKLLIADDDPQMLRALRITLTARGYDVVTAHDGKAALDAAINTHPDIIVIDLGMPGLTGIEVIEAIRGWSSVPVLVVSAAATAGTRWRHSTLERTTTSPNHSRPTSCWRGSAHYLAGLRLLPMIRW